MEKIFYNGKIYSLDKNDKVYEAIGIKDNKITFLGNNEEAEKIQGVEKIDLQGKTVLPGFVDTHLHLLNYAFIQKSFKMYDMKSIDEIVEKGREFIKNNNITGEKWLFGRGWNHEKFNDEKRFLTRHDLDRISTEVPVFLVRACGHIATGNTLAVEKIMKLEKTKEFMENIDVEAGTFKEGSYKLSYDAMEKPSQAEVEDMIKLAARDFNKAGITEVHSDDYLSLPGKDRDTIIKAFKNLEAEGNLNVRVYEQALFSGLEDMENYLDNEYNPAEDGEFYRVGSVKILVDGSLGARTALMKNEYTSEKGQYGIERISETDLNKMVESAHNRGKQVAVHAIGDRAAEMVVDAVIRADKLNPRKDHRHGVVHVQIVDDEILQKMKDHNIIGYIQPIFVATDMDIVEKNLGTERMNHSYMWKTMIDMGIHCCGGSDAPVERFDILENIQLAVTREKLEGGPEGGWTPKEKVSIKEAVKMFTVEAAYACFSENTKGTLEVGKVADMVFLDRDIFESEPHCIKDIKICETIVNGKSVYKR